jgi:hypothetical protein
MLKTFTTLAAAAAVMLAVSIAPKPAVAGDGGAIAAGVLGGIAAGAIIAGAAQNNGPPRAYPNDYYHPGYYGPSYGAHPHRYNDECYYERARYWDQYAGMWRMGPNRLVCP